MALLSGQIAFEIDEAERIATIVFLGPIAEQQVIDFYMSGVVDQAGIDGFDFLFDLRHTKWIPDPATIRVLGLYMRQVRAKAGAGPDSRRIAAVRRDQPEVYASLHGAATQAELGTERLRYFDDIEQARLWVKAGRAPTAG
jgi:hypothetical protein